MENRIPKADVQEVLTRSGLRLHFARPGSDKTLCGHLVEQRRVGGSWWPEMPRGTNQRGACLRCINMVIS